MWALGMGLAQRMHFPTFFCYFFCTSQSHFILVKNQTSQGPNLYGYDLLESECLSAGNITTAVIMKNRNCGMHAGVLVLDKPLSINLFKGFNLFCYRAVYIKLNMQWKLSNR